MSLLAQLIRPDCRTGTIGTVITQDPARLSPDVGQLFALLDIFRKAGVGVEYSGHEGHSDRFFEILHAAVLELEEARR
jgi:hypothetical protein